MSCAFLVARPKISPLVTNFSVRYVGAWPFIHLKVKTASQVNLLF